MAKYFTYPFAIAGDVTPVPNPTQMSGSVSYQSGFPIDYQKVLGVDSGALPIPRGGFNQIMLDITTAIQQYQQYGVFDYITTSQTTDGSPFPYDIYARVRYDGGSGVEVYESLKTANTDLPTVVSSWRVISSPQLPIGSIIDFGTTTPPTGYLGCDGSAVSRTTYASLFAVISTTWGVGDGSTTFNLPDLRRRTTIGKGGTGTGEIGNAVGNIGGEESHTMVVGEIATHNHNGTGSVQGADDISGGNAGFSHHAASIGSAQTVDITMQNAGSSTPFNVIQPSAVVTKMIKYI